MTSVRAAQDHYDRLTSQEADMTPEQSQKLDEIHNQLTGSFNINEYLGFDIDALYTTAAGKGFTNLTLMEGVAVTVKTALLLIDQVVGPDRDGRGPLFTGWDPEALRASIGEKITAGTGLTLPEQVQQAIDHLDDIKAALAGKK